MSHPFSRFGKTNVVGFVVALVGTALGGPGCSVTLEGVGDPCVPENEYQSNFGSYDVDTVVFESNSFQCRTRLCLVNHFQGRVTCPYGQNADGTSSSSKSCTIPASTERVVGPSGATRRAQVDPQCLDRTANKAVYCSCRCANAQGRTDDGGTYCACPDGFQCSQLEGPIGASNEGLTGGFCIKTGTEYHRGDAACGKTCNPNDPTAKCE